VTPATASPKALKEQGVVGQNGVPMCDSTIKDIVTNISYTGTMILQKNYFTESHVRKRNKGELPRYAVEDMYEPLVSAEEYEQAQAIRQHRAEESANANATLTRFSGLVKCGNCGRGISRRTAKTVKKWVCNTRERKGSDVCDMRPLMEEELESAAEKAVGPVSDEEFRRLVKRIYVYGDRIEFRLEKRKNEKRDQGLRRLQSQKRLLRETVLR
jgi:site-specific DNA recombinase